MSTAPHLLTGWSFPAHTLDGLGGAGRARGGWSLGGLQALAGLRDEPMRWPTGILISSTARFCGEADGWPGLPRPALRALQRQLQRAPREALLGFHRLCAGPETDDVVIAQRVEDSLALGLDVLATGLRELDTLDVRADLPAITQPILILHGARDQVIPVQAAERMAELLPQATLIIHPEAHHDLPLAHCAWVAEHIRMFLATQS